MTTSDSKGRFFYKTNRLESTRITNRIDSNRELECSGVVCVSVGHYRGHYKTAKPIEVLFGVWTRVGPVNHVLDGTLISPTIMDTFGG